MSGSPLGLPVGTASMTSSATGASASPGASPKGAQGQSAGSTGAPSGFEAYLASDAAKQGYGERGGRGQDDDKNRLDAAMAAGAMPAFVPMPHDFSAMASASKGGTGADRGATPGAAGPPGQGAFELGAFSAAQMAASGGQGASAAQGASAGAGLPIPAIVAGDIEDAAAVGATGVTGATAAVGAIGATGAFAATAAQADSGEGATDAATFPGASPFAGLGAPGQPMFGATATKSAQVAQPTARGASSDRTSSNSAPQPSASAAGTPGQAGAAPAAGDANAAAQAAALTGAGAPAGANGYSSVGATGASAEQASASASAGRGAHAAHGGAPVREGLKTSGAGTNLAGSSHAMRARGSSGGASAEGDSGSQGSGGDAQSFVKGDVSPDGTTLAGLAPLASADTTVKPLATVTDPTAAALQGHVTGDRLRDALASVQNHAVLRNAASGEIEVPELGRIAVRAHSVSGAVDVDITADRPEARAALHQHTSAMTADLHDADVRVGRMTIDSPHGSGKAGDSLQSDSSSTASSNRQNDGSPRDASHDADDTNPHDAEQESRPIGRVRIVL